jgi:hypothetical protein
MAGNFDNLPLLIDDKEMLKDMYDTISNLKLWDWLAKPGVPGDHGFVMFIYPEIQRITTNMKYFNHSGSSFQFTLSTMEFIAKKGWDKYVSDLLSTPTCPCMKNRGLVGWCGVAGGGVPACDH